MGEVKAPPEIHSTAVVHPSAELGPDVVIGPYCVVGPNVVLSESVRLGAHAVIERDTIVGPGCVIHTGAVLGGDPQDLKFRGENSRLVVGARTIIREFATLNRGTSARGTTEVGEDCLIMAYAHVAHDCVIGNHVVLANAVNMGGHVVIEDWAIVGGITAIHQFARIGQHAIVSGMSAVRKDVPPFVKAAGNPLRLYSLNTVGLQRRGFSEESRRALKQLYRLFFKSNLNISQAMAAARDQIEPLPEVLAFLRFVQESDRGITV